MILLITGATHTGKTLLAQRLLERYRCPYLSMDHLKMGLIRSGLTDLTPQDDEEMTGFLWPVVREIIKTAVENGQHLIVEGCYVPAGWERDFAPEYLREIRFYCLVMTESYIRAHFNDIKNHACAIERRIDDSDLDIATLIAENERYLTDFGYRNDGLILHRGVITEAALPSAPNAKKNARRKRGAQVALPPQDGADTQT